MEDRRAIPQRMSNHRHHAAFKQSEVVLEYTPAEIKSIGIAWLWSASAMLFFLGGLGLYAVPSQGG